MAPLERSSNSNFTVACNLLSQLVKEKQMNNSNVRVPPATMRLMPGAGVEEAAKLAEMANGREEKKEQLTIFYGGKVLVFDNVTAENALDMMRFAGQHSSVVKSTAHVPLSCVQSSGAANAQVQTPAAKSSFSDLPIARKASLQRFLQKRKDRLVAKSPYPTSTSATTMTAAKGMVGLTELFLEAAEA